MRSSEKAAEPERDKLINEIAKALRDAGKLPEPTIASLKKAPMAHVKYVHSLWVNSDPKYVW